jgi:predicted dehydrogenase
MSHPPRIPRVALIGISGYGHIHLQLARYCRDHGEAEIVAAVVINPEEEAGNVAELRAKGCAIYADYGEMLRRHAGEIDLCLIPTGIHWHARMAVAALRSGANVLVEKPLAGSVADAAAVRAVERETGRFVAVGFQDCYDPGTRWLLEEVRGGAIGDVQSVRFLGIWPRSRGYFLRNNWAGRLQVDGVQVLDSPLNNAFGHFVMLSLLLAGAGPGAAVPAPEGVELFRAHDVESFDTGVVTLRTPHGVRLWFGASHVSRATVEPEILVEGAAGTASWRYEAEASHCDARGRRQGRPVLAQRETRQLMMAAALQRLRDPAAPICTTAMAARHTDLIEAIHRAAPITPFPADLVEWAGPNGAESAVPSVPGLDEAMRRAFAEQRPLRECGFALAPGAAGR